MNIIHSGVIMLLKAAILQQPQPLPEGFELKTTMPLIKSHQIIPMIYEGAVNCGISPMEPSMRELFPGYCKILQLSERQMQALGKLYAAFEENQIDYMPLKGCNMKQLYPRPELRTMGDADILIRMEQYERIVPVMEALGFTAKKKTEYELVWVSPELYLELHKCLIPTYNRDMYAYYGDGWNRARKAEGCCHAMTVEDEFIYLFTHFARHFRDGGIGCRHVTDLWVFLRTHPDLDEAYVLGELKKLQLSGFYGYTRSLLSVWFEDGQSDEKTQIMTEFIFSSGSFGQMESRVVSGAIRDAAHSPLGFSGRLLYLCRTAFPGVSVLREKYTVLKRWPWMLPFVWLIRPFYKVFLEPQDLRLQKKNIQALSRENLDQKEQMLAYFDLQYR